MLCYGSWYSNSCVYLGDIYPEAYEVGHNCTKDVEVGEGCHAFEFSCFGTLSASIFLN
jgi:hypothetical protein